jgi:hypothetical protein
MPPAQPSCKLKCAGRECYLKNPAAPNTGKRVLVGSDGRPDTTQPTPGEFGKRFLQNLLAGQDMSYAEYVEGYGTPLDIPTRILNMNSFYIPALKLNSAL